MRLNEEFRSISLSLMIIDVYIYIYVRMCVLGSQLAFLTDSIRILTGSDEYTYIG